MSTPTTTETACEFNEFWGNRCINSSKTHADKYHDEQSDTPQELEARPTRDDVRLMKQIYGEDSDEYVTALANCPDIGNGEQSATPPPTATRPPLEWYSTLPGTEFANIIGMMVRKDHPLRTDKTTVYAIAVTKETGAEWCQAVNSFEALVAALEAVRPDSLPVPIRRQVRAALKLAGR